MSLNDKKTAKALYNDLAEVSTEITVHDEELIRRLSRGIEADWSSRDLLGFVKVMKSISEQVVERKLIILYGSLHPTSLLAFVGGISMRDMVEE